MPFAIGLVAGVASVTWLPNPGAEPVSGSVTAIVFSASRLKFPTNSRKVTLNEPSALVVGAAVVLLAIPTRACGTTENRYPVAALLVGRAMVVICVGGASVPPAVPAVSRPSVT